MSYVQALSYAKNLLKKLMGTSDLSSSSERSRDVDDISVDTGSSSAGSQNIDGLSDLLPLADLWLGRAELLQSLLGSGIIASLDDFADKESSTNLRDRLVSDERYSMAVYTCKKCKVRSVTTYFWFILHTCYDMDSRLNGVINFRLTPFQFGLHGAML